MEEANRFTARMKEKGIRVVSIFPAMEAELYAGTAEHLGGVTAELRERAEFEILGQVTDAVYPRELFYDSPFHLTGRGVGVYTDYVIEQLSSILEEPGERVGYTASPTCPSRPLQVASEPNGWIGASAVVGVVPACTSDGVRLEVHCAMPSAVRPVEVGLYSEGERLTSVVCAADTVVRELVFPIEATGSDFVILELRVDKTFSPSDSDPESLDTRQLGAVIRVPSE